MKALVIWAFFAAQDPIEKDIEEAIRKLSSDRYSAIQDAKAELEEIGAPAVAALVKALREDLDKAAPDPKDPKKPKDPKNSPLLRHTICEILGKIRSPGKDGEVIKVLTETLDDKGEYGTSVASSAATALASIGDRAAAPAVQKLLQDAKRTDADKPLKYACIRALGIFRHKEAVEVLVKALEDKKTTAIDSHDEYAHTIAAAAAEALGKIRAKEGVEGLGKLLSDQTMDPFSQQKLCWHAARALERIEGPRKEGALDGNPEQVDKAIASWRSWYETEFRGRKNVADTNKKIGEIRDAIAKYRADLGKLPLTLRDLASVPADPKDKEKWKGPYYKDAPDPKKTFEDAWGRELTYRTPGTGTAGAELDYDLLSKGADDRFWGGGVNADLWSHDKYVPVVIQRNKERFDEVLKAVQQFKADQGRLPNRLSELTARFEKREKPYLGVAKYDAAVDAIKRFEADQGRLPRTIQELKDKPADAKKWDKPYLEDLTDAWGGLWMYKQVDKKFELSSLSEPRDGFEFLFVWKVNSKDDFELTSLGADNAVGGTGIDADVTNKPKEEKKNGDK